MSSPRLWMVRFFLTDGVLYKIDTVSLALHILFIAGWVHRDISVGNILAVPVRSAGAERDLKWKVKLSDLEFSRIMVTQTE